MFIATCFVAGFVFATTSFDEIHPWAVYLIHGNLADSRSSIIAVDCDAVSKSNMIVGSALFKEEGWNGFRYTGHHERDFFIFKYRIIKHLQDGTLVHCSYQPSGSGSFGCYLLLNLRWKNFRTKGKDESRLILSAYGTYYNFDEVVHDYPDLKSEQDKEKGTRPINDN